MRYAVYLLLLLAAPAFSGEPAYTWHYRADDPDRAYLYRDGKQIGGWCHRENHYRPFDGEKWGPPVHSSPVQPPQRSLVNVTMTQMSPSSPRRRGLRGRIDAALDEAMRNYVNSPGFLSGLKFSFKLDGLFDLLAKDLYLADVFYSAKLFAHVEMGGKLSDKDDGDGHYFMTKGSARLFLSERAGFTEKLKEEKFSKPSLTTMLFEVADDNPKAWEALAFAPELSGLRGAPGDKLQSRLLFNAANWREDPKTVAADTPAVALSITRRAKDAQEKIPVTIRCSFICTAWKDGKPFEKTLSFDLYVETLETGKDGDLSYPWKVRNVDYK